MISVFLTTVLLSLMVGMFPVELNAQSTNTDDAEIIAYSKFFIGVEDEYAFELQFEVEHYYITTVNSSVVSIFVQDGVYYIKGVSAGTTMILVNYVVDGVLDSKACEIEVMNNYTNSYQNAFYTETFYIYGAARNALFSANISAMTVGLSTWQESNSLYSSWQIISAGNGYYYIYLYTQNVYLEYENGQIQIAPTLTSEEVQKWRILVNADGYHVLVPEALEHTNMALATNGVDVYVGDYYSGYNARKLKIIQKTFYLDNYYDSSFGLNQNVITYANEFVRDYAFYGTGFTFDFSQSFASKNDLLADQCSHGNNIACDDTCGEDCQNHHKNWNLMLLDLWENVQRAPNHISTLWANRMPEAYCNNHNHDDDYTETKGYTIGAQLYSIDEDETIIYETRYPVLNILTLSAVNSISLTDTQIEATAVISLAHEVAHTMYMYEAYEIFEKHTTDNCDCIMNVVDYDTIVDFYEKITNYEINPLCDTCMQHLTAQANTILYVNNNESINTRESFTGGN